VTVDLESHRHRLWGVAYRILGTRADADEVVQEAFVRALTRPPADTSRPWGPWLTTVAANLAKDRLRARRRRGWVGPWLPEPIVDAGPDGEATAALRESASYAWMAAAEQLTPGQRAVLVLREAADLDVEETAAALQMTPGSVRATHLRARRALGQPAPAPADAAALAAAQVALFGFLSAVAAGDLPAARALLADDVVVRSDGGGRYTAARLPVVGADRVLKLYQGLGRLGVPTRVEPRVFNGQPGVLAAFDAPPAGFAGQWAMVADVVEGRIVALYSVLVEEKVPGW
jgi:RNA polymerase sigma factor (sigma-70 family)